MDDDNFLEHHGVKGMRWGVRRNLKKLSTEGERQAYLNSRDAKWLAKIENKPKVARVVKRSARRMKREVYPELNKEYKKVNLKKSTSARAAYWGKASDAHKMILEEEAYKAHKMSPTRTREVQLKNNADGTIKLIVVPRDNAKLRKQRVQVTRAVDHMAKKKAKADAKLQHGIEDLGLLIDNSFDPDDDPYLGLEMTIITDELGHFVDIKTPVDDVADDELAHEDAYEDFIAHIGVKGMRWGVHRTDAQLGSGGKKGGGTKSSDDKKDDQPDVSHLKNLKVGQVAVINDPQGRPTLMMKQKDGTFKETHLAVDAERTVKTLNKTSTSEMSDREMKEAVARAKTIEEYNKTFSSTSDLENKVKSLKLEQEYSSLQSQLHPTNIQRLVRLVKTVSPAFEDFKKLDAMTGNVMSNMLKESLDLSKASSSPREPRQKQPKQPKQPKASKVKAPKNGPAPKAKKGTKVYDITDVGRSTNYPNPFQLELTTGR